MRRITRDAYAEYATRMAPSAWRGLDRAIRDALDAPPGAADVLVAECAGRLVGSVFLFAPAAEGYGGALTDLRWPELRLLAVSPEGRGAGVGRALVEACVRRARETGATEIGLHTSKSMEAAIRLYESMGFERAPERDFRPAGAELVTGYRLPLSAGRSIS